MALSKTTLTERTISAINTAAIVRQKEPSHTKPPTAEQTPAPILLGQTLPFTPCVAKEGVAEPSNNNPRASNPSKTPISNANSKNKTLLVVSLDPCG